MAVLLLQMQPVVAEKNDAYVTAKDYRAYLEREQVTLTGVEVTKVDEEGHDLTLTASEDLKAGDVVLKIPATAFISANTHLSSNKKQEIEKWIDAIKDMDSTIIEGGEKEVALAIRLLVQPGTTHDIVMQKEAISGANVTHKPLLDCMYSDIATHIEALRHKLDAFSNAAETLGLSNGVFSFRTLLYTLQHGAALPYTNDFVIFPGMELLKPAIYGGIRPDKLYGNDGEEVKPRDGVAPAVAFATFKVSHDVAKGEMLTTALNLGIFRSAALYGEIDNNIAGLPLELTWAALSSEAKETLRKFKCGGTAVGLVTREGGFADSLETCMNVVAAYQTYAEKGESEVAKLAEVNFEDAESLTSDIRLAGFDLMLHLFDEHLKKLPAGKECYKEDFMAPVLSSLNSNIRSCLEAATEKLKQKADKYLDAIEKNDPTIKTKAEEAEKEL